MKKESRRTGSSILMDRFGYAKTVDVATLRAGNKGKRDAENKWIVNCINTETVYLPIPQDASD